MARWVWRLPGPLSPAWCPRFRKTGKSGKCQGRSCGDTETPHSQGRIRGSLAGKPGWEPITARFFSRGTQESLPSLLLNMQSSAEIILAKNTSHTPSPHRLSSLEQQPCVWRPSACRAPSPRRHRQARGFIEPGREGWLCPGL